MNDQKFLLWKLALSTIHVDGKVDQKEEKWFNEKIKFLKENKILDFSNKQIEELTATLKKPVNDMIGEFENLKNPADCAQLVSIIRLISNVDGVFEEKEKEMLKKVEQACLKGVDLKAMEQKIHIMGKESYQEYKIYKKVGNRHSLFEKVFKDILKILNPGA